MKTNKTLLLVATTTFCHLSGANAAVTVTATQVGPNVVFSGSGVFNLSALIGPVFTTNIAPSIYPLLPTLVISDFSAPVGIYEAETVGGPSSYGAGPFSPQLADSRSGDSFGFTQTPDSELHLNFYLPEGYVSNSPLSGTMTFNNETFATLGLTEGTYTWTWSTNANNDSMTLNVIPEPASSLLGALTFVAVSLVRRRSPQV